MTLTKAPISDRYPQDPDGIQSYGNAVVWTRNVPEAAIREVVEHNMWLSITEIIAREGRGHWVKTPKIGVRTLSYPDVENSLASVVKPPVVMVWEAEYWPHARRDSWLRRAGLPEAADELATKEHP